jgi:hypothetical protein
MKGPYPVPAWRFGWLALDLPGPPLWLSLSLWAAFGLAGIWLMFGSKSKLVTAIPIFVLVYLGSVERWAFSSSFVIMLFLYLVALLFDRQPRSCSRSIIKAAISICYFFGAVTKLDAEFASGAMLDQLVNHGYNMRPLAFSLLSHIRFGSDLLQAIVYTVIATELFLSVGFWFRRTRKYAIALGLLMHGTFLILIQGIDIFAPIMWTGYLAFLDKKQENEVGEVEEQPIPAAERFAALLVLLFMLWMPARFFIPIGPTARPIADLSYFDRAPWGFSMFIFRQDVEQVSARYHDVNGWHSEAMTGRMKEATSDDEILALARYLLKKHQLSDQVEVKSSFQINGHRRGTKECIYSRSDSGYRHINLYYQPI